MKSETEENNNIANGSDYLPVSILFEDEDINYIFSALLEARGIPTRVLSNITEFSGQTRIITEPQYFPLLNKESHRRCLVIGNKESLKGLDVLSLSRPLTEEKIEEALSMFLKN